MISRIFYKYADRIISVIEYQLLVVTNYFCVLKENLGKKICELGGKDEYSVDDAGDNNKDPQHIELLQLAIRDKLIPFPYENYDSLKEIIEFENDSMVRLINSLKLTRNGHILRVDIKHCLVCQIDHAIDAVAREIAIKEKLDNYYLNQKIYDLIEWNETYNLARRSWKTYAVILTIVLFLNALIPLFKVIWF